MEADILGSIHDVKLLYVRLHHASKKVWCNSPPPLPLPQNTLVNSPPPNFQNEGEKSVLFNQVFSRLEKGKEVKKDNEEKGPSLSLHLPCVCARVFPTERGFA